MLDVDVNLSKRWRKMSSGYPDKVKSAGNQPDLSSPAGKKSRKISTGFLSRHQNLLIGELRGRRSFGDKRQLEVVADLTLFLREREPLQGGAAEAGCRKNAGRCPIKN
jgi:hypothetical protein